MLSIQIHTQMIKFPTANFRFEYPRILFIDRELFVVVN